MICGRRPTAGDGGREADCAEVVRVAVDVEEMDDQGFLNRSAREMALSDEKNDFKDRIFGRMKRSTCLVRRRWSTRAARGGRPSKTAKWRGQIRTNMKPIGAGPRKSCRHSAAPSSTPPPRALLQRCLARRRLRQKADESFCQSSSFRHPQGRIIRHIQRFRHRRDGILVSATFSIFWQPPTLVSSQATSRG